MAHEKQNMNTVHYLDNSATTRVSPAAAQKALYMMTEQFGNPSSLHSMGFSAERELESARDITAAALGADAGEIYFTSGGTEANNLAVFGAAQARKRIGSRIVTTAAEHSSVLDSMHELEHYGFEVVYIKPSHNGELSLGDIENAIDDKTVLVSVMAINNETGAVFPFDFVAPVIKRKKAPALLHVDAVQAFGKLDKRLAKTGADLMSISGHKIHAPKGVGALYVKKGVRIMPRAFGGKQEKKLRPGTESLPLICALAQAISELDIARSRQSVGKLNSYLRQGLTELGCAVINSPDSADDYILNFSVPGFKSETMLHHLAQSGVFVSSGSACSKGGKSHVLAAMGLDDSLADSALRVSFSSDNTVADCDALTAALQSGINTLVRKSK